jgi:hypothetical protein
MTGAIMNRFSSDQRKPLIRITPKAHAMISPQIARRDFRRPHKWGQ